jgi:hypothetical protein
MPGPVPKRSEARRRRNKDGGTISRAAHTTPEKLGPDVPDDLSLTGLAVRWYESLRTSGQAVYYTDSDWASALVVAVAIQKFEERPSAGILTAVLQGMGSLLATEGDRRRMRLELERAADEDPAELAAVADFAAYQKSLGG